MSEGTPRRSAWRGQDKRPVLRLVPTRADAVAGVLAVVGLAAIIGVLVWSWPSLPAKVPIHFGFSGVPDAWGARSFLLLFPGLALVIHVGLSIMAFYPHTFNYLWPITEDNAPSQYRLGSSLMRWLRTWVIWGLAYVQWRQAWVALGRSTSLGTWWAPVLVLVTLSIVTTYLYIGSKTAGPP